MVVESDLPSFIVSGYDSTSVASYCILLPTLDNILHAAL